MDWLDGYYENKAVARLVIYDGSNFRDSAGNAISVSGSGESNTATSIGAGGIAVVDGKVGVDLQFRSIIAGSSKASITLDNTDHEVVVDVVETELDLANIQGAIDLGGSQAGGTLAAGRFPALTGAVTTTAGSVATSLAANAVTNAKMAAMAANTVKANATGSSADPTDLAMAASTMVGRGPTGNIDDLAVGAGLTITNTTIGRAAITGDVNIGEDSNTSAIAANAITTAMIQADAVGNVRLSNMANGTLKGRGTAATGDPEDLAMSGGLVWSAGSVKSKGSFTFRYLFDSSTTEADPGTGEIRFNADGSEVYISSTSVNGINIGLLLENAINGSIGYIANNETSTVVGQFNLTAATDNTDWYTLATTPLPGFGSDPANGEEVVIFIAPGAVGLTTQGVLDMDVVRTNASGQLIDATGVVISGSPSVADYAALVALDPEVYDGFAINVQSGLNNSLWVSNGTAWGPLNGEYVQERSTTASVQKLIVPNAAITWTASNSGGVVRLTSSGAHGLTTTPAVGAQIYVTAGTGWTAGSFHQIATVVSTTVIDLTTVFSSHGNPTVADAGDEVPVKIITLPVLRSTTTVIVEAYIEFSADAGSSSRRPKFLLDATELNNFNFTSSTNTNQPVRWGFRNTGATNAQQAIAGKNSTGYATSTETSLTAAVDTSTSKTMTLAFIPAAANCVMELVNYVVTIKG